MKKILLIILAVVVLAGGGLVGWRVWQQHKKAHDPSEGGKFLVIKEWGVRMPLSITIADAYYIVSTSSRDKSGQPNTIWLGLKSLDRLGSCAATNTNTDGRALGALIRALSSDTAPVDGETYQQKYPNGTFVNGYYYGYEDWITHRACTTDAKYQEELSNINIAFAVAARHITKVINE